MRVAVTGASGFCGAHVARAAAARGDEVLCLSRREGPVGTHIPWDAASEVPDLRGAEVVVHCAAAVGDHQRGSAAEAEQVAVNVHGTERLLEAAAKAGAAIVHVSSASVYDTRRNRDLITEDHPAEAGHLNAYGATKAVADRAAQAAGAVVLRPRAVYGDGDPHLLPRLLACQRRGLMPLPGGDVILSLTAVETLADACLAAATWPPGAYNIVDAEPYPRDDAVLSVLRAFGRGPARIVHVPPAVLAIIGALSIARLTPYALDQLAHTVVLDSAKARRQGFAPTRTLADYLSRAGRPDPSRVPADRPPPRPRG
ncbi:NAD(P)-dependent oxidoreductase [Actinospica durhamensis]|uniref:NAD(P)-dependent oxidoreductase n=1 Tax=Actinospica durhamensis TaxID=1508375 RepID=A0A941EZT3_9ACTN|nr:NAD(P)-dependent oxidoreductase [Actinospica durhamensis]MBR7838359.1 NAD(P)-dependent oxidoreductase [Actinospica durhamensis]